MSNNDVIIYHPPTPFTPSHVDPVEIPPAVKRGAEIVGSLTVGAIGGYIFYWITRLVARLGMLGEVGGGAIHPLPYILTGVVSAAIVETARLTYDVTLKVLGDRQTYENLADPDKASTFDSLRQRTWKVITRLEKLEHDIDVIFSRLFHIRTAQEIRDKKIPDRQLYFMEVTRREFWVQVRETISTAVPQELGIYAVEAAGYTVLGGHLFAWLYGIMFLNGLIDKVGKVYQKIHQEEIEEMQKRKRAFENKVTCDLLGALYPDEIAELDAQETSSSGDNEVQDSVEEDPMDIEGEEDETSIEEDEGVIEEFVKTSGGFDPRDYKDLLAYRHTVFQATYPIEGFEAPADDEEVAENEADNVQEAQEMQQDELPDNFVLVEVERK